MTDSFEDFPEDILHELAPNERLAGFLFDQFQEATVRRVRDMGRVATRRGSPIGHVLDTGEASVIAGTESIILKPPHPYDSKGNYAEAYAYVSPTPTDLVLDYAGRKIYLTGTYRLQLRSRNAENDETWLVDSKGAYAIGDDAANITQDPDLAALQAIENSIYVYEIVGSYAPVFRAAS